MEIYLVEKSKDSITLRIKNADMTFITPLLRKLAEDENVAVVRYIEKHPELIDPVIFLKMSKGGPEAALKKASGSIGKDFSGIKTK